MVHDIRDYFNVKRLIQWSIPLAVVVLAFVWVVVIAKEQHQEHVHHWQIQLNRIADNTAADVGHWVEKQFHELGALASNESLKLYLTDLGGMADPSEDAKPFQEVYLRNLLIVTAKRAGFDSTSTASEIRANIDASGNAGIALLNSDRDIVVTTPFMPPLRGHLKHFVQQVTPGEKQSSPIYRDSAGQLVMAFSVPIYRIQSTPSPESQIGMVIGVRKVSDSLFALLKQPGITEASLESVLVRPDYQNNKLVYLSPLNDGTEALAKSVDINQQHIAAVFASQYPGGFSFKRDYGFIEVMATGRRISETPWFLVTKINRSEALAKSDAKRDNMMIVGISIIVLTVFAFLLVWRHGISVKVSREAERYRKLSDQYASQKAILQLISDNKPEPLFIVDEGHHCIFANAHVLSEHRMKKSDIKRKHITEIIKGDLGQKFVELNNEALLSGKIVGCLHEEKENGTVMQSKHVPLASLPGRDGQGVLILEQDITQSLGQQTAVIMANSSIIETLIDLLDKRDHFSASNALHVATFCFAVANSMGLNDSEKDLAEISGMLMNIGKFFVPLKILQKKTKWTDAELKTVSECLAQGADLLHHIAFEGDVVSMIRQAHDYKIGSKSKKFELIAKIMSVSNIFISTIRPRQASKQVSLDKAISELKKLAKTEDEKKIVDAIIQYIEHDGGRDYLVANNVIS